MLYIQVYSGGQSSSDVICLYGTEEEASVLCLLDEHFESFQMPLRRS